MVLRKCKYVCITVFSKLQQVVKIACIAGWILHTSALVLVPSREHDEALRGLVRSQVELCVSQCMEILDWLRVGKRQSNVDQYLSSIAKETIVFVDL